jgi:hypothetical protein
MAQQAAQFEQDLADFCHFETGDHGRSESRIAKRLAMFGRQPSTGDVRQEALMQRLDEIKTLMLAR